MLHRVLVWLYILGPYWCVCVCVCVLHFSTVGFGAVSKQNILVESYEFKPLFIHNNSLAFVIGIGSLLFPINCYFLHTYTHAYLCILFFLNCALVFAL